MSERQPITLAQAIKQITGYCDKSKNQDKRQQQGWGKLMRYSLCNAGYSVSKRQQ